MPWNGDLGEHPITQFRFPKELYFDLKNLVACTYVALKVIPYGWSWAHGKEKKFPLKYVTQVIKHMIPKARFICELKIKVCPMVIWSSSDL